MLRLGILKKLLYWTLILLAVCSLLLVAQIKIATYIFDAKIYYALAKVERKIPGLKLQYESTGESFTERKGRLHFTLPLKKGNTLGVSAITGAVDTTLLFGPLRLSGGIDSVPGSGNIDDILAKFNIDPISFTGAFKVTAITPSIRATIKTDSFLIPTSTGICKFGQNAFNFSATSTEDVDVALRSAGVVCEGAERYNNSPNYRLDLLGVELSLLPRIIDKKPHFESLIVNFEKLDFKFSTLYAIGFTPEDEVRDPSLQDGISFNNVSTMITLTQPDAEGMSKLSFDNSGNYGFAFPLIRYGVEQPYYELNDFKFAGSLERISIPKLYDASKAIVKGADEKFDTSKVFKEVMKGFTDVIGITIEQFGYTHNNQSFSVQGRTDLSFDEHSVKPKLARFDSDYKITADKSLVREVAGTDYQKPLDQAIWSGQISDDGERYTTALKLHGTSLSLNDIPVTNLVSNDDMLYEEEQKALKQQKEELKAQEEALKAEIKAAKEAQKNLPSLVEGNLNSENKALALPEEHAAPVTKRGSGDALAPINPQSNDVTQMQAEPQGAAQPQGAGQPQGAAQPQGAGQPPAQPPVQSAPPAPSPAAGDEVEPIKLY